MTHRGRLILCVCGLLLLVCPGKEIHFELDHFLLLFQWEHVRFAALASTHRGECFNSLEPLSTSLLFRAEHLLAKCWRWGCHLSHSTTLLMGCQLPLARLECCMSLTARTFRLLAWTQLCVRTRIWKVLMRASTAVAYLRVHRRKQTLSRELSLIMVCIRTADLVRVWSWIFPEFGLLLQIQTSI